MRRADALLAVLVMVIWGANFVVLKIGLETYPPFVLLALRFVIAALPVFFIAPPRIGAWRVIAFGATAFLGQFALLFLALSKGLPAGLAAVVMQSQVLFTVMLAALLLRERLGAKQAASIAVACSGLIVIATTLGHDAPLMGVALVVLGGLSWAFGNLVARTTPSTETFRLVIWAGLVPIAPAAALAAWLEGPTRIASSLTHPTVAGVAALLYTSVLSTIVAFAGWAYLLRRYPAATVAPFALLVPPIGMFAGAVVFGEAFPPARLVGVLLILAGVGLVLVPSRARAPVRATEKMVA
jgi:O-acetylserine/cysteine efflux transporter